MNILVGNTKIKFITNDECVFNNISKIYHSFLCNNDEEVTNVIEVTGKFDERESKEGLGTRIKIENSGNKFFLLKRIGSSIKIIGLFNKRRNTWFIDANKIHTRHNLFSYIQRCIEFFLEENGGFILHATCGVIDDNGVVFAGKSGSGKSTALKCLHPDYIVSDNHILISPYIYSNPSSLGSNDFSLHPQTHFFTQGTEKMKEAMTIVEEFYAYSLPGQKEENRSAKIKCVFFPRKIGDKTLSLNFKPAESASEIIPHSNFNGIPPRSKQPLNHKPKNKKIKSHPFYVEPVDKISGTIELLQNIISPCSTTKKSLKKIFNTVFNFAEKTKIYNLYFSLNDNYRQYIKYIIN